MSKNDNEPTRLETVIDNALAHIENSDPSSEEYAAAVDQIAKLYAMTPTKESWIKPDALIGVFGNLAGIVAILGYERAHVITSKALGFVFKSKI